MTVLFSSARVQIGRLDLRDTDPEFRVPRTVEHNCLEFRRRPLLLRHDNRSVVVGPNEVTLWKAGETYERRAMERGYGDAGVWYAIAADVLPPFETTAVPCDAALFLRERALLDLLECGAIAPAEVEEEVLDIAEGLVLSPATPAAQSKRIEHAKFTLSRDLTGPVSIRDIAADVGLSIYHLSKVFRDATGHSMIQYRQQLRLRMAFDEIMRAESLYEIANDLGFADHSHFTRVFRRVFGTTPRALRKRRAC